MRKTNPLTKLRFKPQVSAAFALVSILMDAYGVNPKPSRLCGKSQTTQSGFEVCRNSQATSIA
jgi:hypothetical protein